VLREDWTFPAAVNRLNRRLARLVEAGALARFRPEAARGAGSEQYHYHIPGARPCQWKHVAGVAEVRACLVADGRVKLVCWETEPLLAGMGGQRADALAVIERGKLALAAYVEVDRGTMTRRAVRAKLDAYRTHERSGLWLREPWVRLQSTPTYPLVWVVTGRKCDEPAGVWVIREAGEGIDRWLSMTTSSGVGRGGR